MTEIIDKVDFANQKAIILLNKTDMLDDNKNVIYTNNIVALIESKGFTTRIVKNDTKSVLTDNFKENRSPNSIDLLQISAKTGSGICTLRGLLASTQRDLLGDSDTTLVTNQRHVQALADAHTSLLRVREGLASGLPTDLAAQDIREAIYSLGSIVGEISTDEVLGNIFRNFCIGK